MRKNALPLKEISIKELYIGDEKAVYEIPIYQRNYAWEKDEISTLIQDVYDAYKKNQRKVYYIGTLVSYHKGDCVYEINRWAAAAYYDQADMGCFGDRIQQSAYL